MSQRVISIGDSASSTTGVLLAVGTSKVTVQTSLAFNGGSGVAALQDLILQNVYSPCQVQEKSLVAGNNTITVPQEAGGVIIIPAETNSGGLVLKGVNGDTGVELHAAAPSVLPFLFGGNVTFVLNFLGTPVYEQVGVTLDNTTDKITKNAHGLGNGTRVLLTGTSLPPELHNDVWYYVVSSAANDFQVSETAGGQAIDFSTNGSAVVLTTSQRVLLVWI